MTNILLIGQMGSGKDTAADYLAKEHGYYLEKLGLYIRKHVNCLFFDLTDDQKRKHYQAYGEGMRDIFGEHFWCERLDARLERDKRYICNCSVLITDCRQEHELDYFIERGYKLIAIDADAVTRINRLQARDGSQFDPETFTHPTEASANRIIDRIKRGALAGYVVKNDGTEKHLYEQLDKVMEQLCSGAIA